LKFSAVFHASINWLHEAVFTEVRPMTHMGWWARAVLGLIAVAWGISVWAMPLTQMPQMLHLSVILFHEAGHIFFRPFGEVMGVAGGTLGQLLMPLICCVAIRRHGDPFGAGLALAWMGLSFMDASVYAFDAFDPVLPLIGGGTGADSFHDFIFLFDLVDQTHRARGWASAINAVGAVVMFVGWAWSAIALFHTSSELVDDDFAS
jgi:hypothetical protein